MTTSASERPKGRSLRPLRALAPFLLPHRAIMAFALVALLVASGAMLALPMAARQVIDHGLAGGDPTTLDRYFLGFLGAAVIFGVFAALRFYLVTWVGERVVADVRTAVFRQVLQMDMTFF